MSPVRRFRPGIEPAITLSEEGGVRYLHFGNEWVQGAMRLRASDRLALEYLERMMAWLLFLEAPARMLQIGVGAGSLVRFCHRHLPGTHVTGVELSPRVLAVARQCFRLPDEDERLRLVVGDGAQWVSRAASRARYGVIVVDAFDAGARRPVLDSASFYAACRSGLAAPGILVVNLFGSHPSLARNRVRLREAFDGRVLELIVPGEPNVIALAFAGPPLQVGWRALRERSIVLSRYGGLPARSWVSALAAQFPAAANFSI